MGIDLGALLADAEKRYGSAGGGAARDLGSLFRGGAVAEQLLVWGVLNQLLGTVLTPPLMFLQRGINSEMQAVPLSPPLLADMVNRNIMTLADATNYAKQSGVSPEDFARMAHNAGEPPSPQEMLAAYRRGLVPLHGTGHDSTSVEQAIAESRLYPKYTDVIVGLADVPLDPSEAVDAVVEGQIPFDLGQKQAYLSGISAEHFQIMVNTRGNPPSPTEALELYRRGLIPLEGTGPDVVSFQQAIFEGATKDKWWKLFAQLNQYVVPPRTVTAMIREGTLTDEQGLAELAKSGVTGDLAAGYVASAHHAKTQSERDLTVSYIKALYQDGLITPDEADQMLGLLNYNKQDQLFLRDVWDFEVLQKNTRATVDKIHSLYVNHKIDQGTASNDLDAAGVPAKGRDTLLTQWNIERQANVPTLTRAEVVDAWFYGVIDTATAVAMLIALGWTAQEAVILYGIRSHGKAAPAPAPGG